MIKILNLTKHEQSKKVKSFLEEELKDNVEITNPRAPTIDPGDGMDEIRNKVGLALSEARQYAHPEPYKVNGKKRTRERTDKYQTRLDKNREVDAILVGGLTSAMHIAIEIAEVPVIEIGTERVRDDNDRFIFIPKSVREIKGSIIPDAECPRCGGPVYIKDDKIDCHASCHKCQWEWEGPLSNLGIGLSGNRAKENWDKEECNSCGNRLRTDVPGLLKEVDGELLCARCRK